MEDIDTLILALREGGSGPDEEALLIAAAEAGHRLGLLAAVEMCHRYAERAGDSGRAALMQVSMRIAALARGRRVPG